MAEEAAGVIRGVLGNSGKDGEGGMVGVAVGDRSLSRRYPGGLPGCVGHVLRRLLPWVNVNLTSATAGVLLRHTCIQFWRVAFSGIFRHRSASGGGIFGRFGVSVGILGVAFRGVTFWRVAVSDGILGVAILSYICFWEGGSMVCGSLETGSLEGGSVWS